MRETCGIDLQPGKEALVQARLVRRLSALGLSSFFQYVRLLSEDSSGSELRRMVDALTTNQTSFFREPRQFEFLDEILIPELGHSKHPIRIWSAGCSSGEEPYSIAMALCDRLAGLQERDARILATDISERILTEARTGSYSETSMRAITEDARSRHFAVSIEGAARSFHVKDRIRSMVAFARLNLQGECPMRGPFDAIFCRNVMIYFDFETRQALIDRFWSQLRSGGYLFVGSAESLTGMRHSFQYVQPAIFRKDAQHPGIPRRLPAR